MKGMKMNKKLSITLLSVVFACTSNAMEHTDEATVSHWEATVHNGVTNDVGFLKEQNRLDQPAVYRSIKRHLQSVPAFQGLQSAVREKYRERYTPNEDYTEYLDGEAYEHLEGGGFLRANGYKNKIAVVLREKEELDCAHLYMWHLATLRWHNNYLGAVGDAYAACWGTDDELIVLSEDAICVLPTPNKDGFEKRCTFAFESKSDYFYAWNSRLKILAIEVRSEANCRDADVALVQLKDGALSLMQTIALGKDISSLFFRVDKQKREALRVWADYGRDVAEYVKEGDEYKLEEGHKYPRREPRPTYDSRLGLGELFVDHDSDVQGVGFFCGSVYVKTERAPLHAIAKQLAEPEFSKDKQDEGDEA